VRVVFDFQNDPGAPFDVSPLIPARLLEMQLRDMHHLELQSGKERIPLGDLCCIHQDQEGDDCVLIKGHTSSLHRLGWKMSAGRLILAGNAGRWVGAGMSGGELFVQGDAGDNAGVGMSGGFLSFSGSVGESAGGAKAGAQTGMNGGVIIIGGNAGDLLGERMRRGLIFCSGNAGKLCGAGMLAGSILVAGRLGAGAGLRMRRGSIAAGSSVPLLPGFHKSGAAAFGWISLACSWLQRLGANVPLEWKTGCFLKYCGHDLELNKGEILIYDPDQ